MFTQEFHDVPILLCICVSCSIGPMLTYPLSHRRQKHDVYLRFSTIKCIKFGGWHPRADFFFNFLWSESKKRGINKVGPPMSQTEVHPDPVNIRPTSVEVYRYTLIQVSLYKGGCAWNATQGTVGSPRTFPPVNRRVLGPRGPPAAGPIPRDAC